MSLDAIQLPCILPRLVVAEESTYQHAHQSVRVLVDDDIEVTHQIVREVISRQLVQQLVLIHAIRLICQHKHIAGITLETQRVDLCRIARHADCRTQRPHITHIEFTAMQRATLLHTTEYHTRHFADLAILILLHHLLHALHTTLRIAVVQHAQTFNEKELRAVLA